MAREESDREDLLREATALVERMEISLQDATGAPAAGDADHVVIGFRTSGAASFFFGADPVYQFNAAGELRRAYCDGLLYKAAGGRLVSLRRVRTTNETQLQRRDLTDNEQRDFLLRVQERLSRLAAALSKGKYELVGQTPAEADIERRVEHWFAAQISYRIAAAPNV